jgi:uridine kinase
VDGVIIIGIAGGSGAGKTTVARTIAEKLGEENVAYLSQDWYYNDRSKMTMEDREKENLDHPKAFDTKLLVSHLNLLRKGMPIEVPVYDYSIHSRSKETVRMVPRTVAIVEGILVLAIEELRSIFDFKIFVDADPDIRLIRRINRDIKERGSTYEKTIDRYLTTVKPMHEAFIEPSKKYADIIVPRGGQNNQAINLLADMVEHFVEHHAE